MKIVSHHSLLFTGLPNVFCIVHRLDYQILIVLIIVHVLLIVFSIVHRLGVYVCQLLET